MSIRISNVHKTFGNNVETQVKALRGIDLEIEKGEFMAIIGPSGSGKTTLLNLLGGLDLPTTGDIFFDNKKINDLNMEKRTQHRLNRLGFIFQDYQLLPILSVQENVELPLRLQGIKSAEIKERIEWSLKEVGIWSLKDRFPAQISGGQQQRVSIARAIAPKPTIILADEPTANLDSNTGQDIINLFKKLNEKFNQTFVFSTHDPRLISQVKRVGKITDGQISF